MGIKNQFHESLDRKEDLAPSSDRSFCQLFAFCGVFLAAYQWYNHIGRPVVWLIFVGVLLIISWCRPSLAAPLNRLWMRLGLLLARVTNPLVLALMYYFAIVPIAFWMRITGKDVLRLKVAADAASYWIMRTPPGPAPDTIKNQF